MDITKKKTRKKKKKLELEITESFENKRSENPPKKSENYEGWFTWYQDEIRERISNGQSKETICCELKIGSIDKFINNER